MRRCPAPVLASLLAATAFDPSTARAYRTFADDPEVGALALPTGQPVIIALAASDRPEHAGFLDALRSAAETWAAPDCTGLRVLVVASDLAQAEPGDGELTVELVHEGWLARGLPAGRGATTDVQHRVSGGHAEIVEADIYVNLDELSYDPSDPDALDRQGVLTHELGHLLGLLHPCEDAAPGVPECAGDEHARESALFPVYAASERTLGADDVAAVCTLYPAGACRLSCGIDAQCRGVACAACEEPGCAAPCPGPACAAGPMCGAHSECTEGVCAAFGPSAGECVVRGAPGASCRAGGACESGLCVQQDGVGHCTTACTVDDECAESDACAFLEGRSVCVPRPIARCSVDAWSGASGLWVFGTAASALLWRRRRRLASPLVPHGLTVKACSR